MTISEGLKISYLKILCAVSYQEPRVLGPNVSQEEDIASEV